MVEKEKKEVIRLDFSPNKVSEIEYRLLLTIAESKFALTTPEIHNKTILKMCEEKEQKLEKYDEEEAEKLRKEMFEIEKKFLEGNESKNKRKGVESVATLFRKRGMDVPTYQRLMRILELLYLAGWVFKIQRGTGKAAILWAIDEKIREKILKTKN